MKNILIFSIITLLVSFYAPPLIGAAIAVLGIAYLLFYLIKLIK